MSAVFTLNGQALPSFKCGERNSKVWGWYQTRCACWHWNVGYDELSVQHFPAWCNVTASENVYNRSPGKPNSYNVKISREGTLTWHEVVFPFYVKWSPYSTVIMKLLLKSDWSHWFHLCRYVLVFLHEVRGPEHNPHITSTIKQFVQNDTANPIHFFNNYIKLKP